MGIFSWLTGNSKKDDGNKEQRTALRHFDILKYDGIRALKIGETAYAIRCFEEALQLVPDDAETRGALAQAYIQADQATNARPVLLKLTEQIPDSGFAWLTLAQVNLLLEYDEEALANCQTGLALKDEHQATLCYTAGIAHSHLNDPINAIVMLTRAIALDKHMEQAYRTRSSVLRSIGQLKEAETDIDYLLSHFAPNEENLMLKGNIRAVQGHKEEAIHYYNLVHKANPFHRESYLALSRMYSETHALDQSLRVINEAIEFLPDFAEAYKERGRIRYLLNDKAGATADLERSIRLAPENMQTFDGEYNNLSQTAPEPHKPACSTCS